MKYLKVALGMFLIPIVLFIFIADRILMVFLIHLPSPGLVEYFEKTGHIIMAFYRVATVSILLTLYLLIFG